MDELKDLPGTAVHRKMLQSIVSYYENDPRILAITVFGSLGSGTWDRYSDIDLDVVVADSIKIDIEPELLRLSHAFASIDEQIALLIPYEDKADVVFKSLTELSVRYHILATTSPNIVDSMLFLSGCLDRATIEAAGRANQNLDHEPLDRELDRCIRYALEVDNALRRGYLWSAIELLQSMRHSLMELFTRSHHGKRACQFFQKEADERMQNRLGRTLPQFDPQTAHRSLRQFIDILTNDLDQLTNGQVELTKIHSDLLTAIASRQNHLPF